MRFLRELTLFRKTLVLAACLALPVGATVWSLVQQRVDALRQIAAADHDAHLFAHAGALVKSLSDIELAAPSARGAAIAAHDHALAELRGAARQAGWSDPARLRRMETLAPLHGGDDRGALRAQWQAALQLMDDLGRARDVGGSTDSATLGLQMALTTDLASLVRDLSTLAAPATEADARQDLGPLIHATLMLERVQGAIDAAPLDSAAGSQLGAGALAPIRRSLQDAERQLAQGAAPAIAPAILREAIALQARGLDLLAASAASRYAAERGRDVRDSLLAGVAMLVCGYLLVCMYKVMRGGLEALCRHLALLGAGNLAREPVGYGRDEMGQALSSLGLSVRGMATLFSVVNQGVGAVSHAAREVAAGNAGLAARTEEIRRDIADVSRRAHEFSSAMGDCGEYVDKAAGHVRQIRNETLRSRNSMQQLRDRMRALQAKSQEINRIVGMMESTAYQTRLLSLNASVEASRAGEAGKGFSIVAAEVRALAQRSHDAAQRIRGIVGTSVELIEDGNVMAERAGKGVQATFDVTEEVTQVMDAIVELTRAGLAQSSEMQSTARHVEDAVSGNARLVAQLSDASAALRREGDKLKRSAHAFVFE